MERRLGKPFKFLFLPKIDLLGSQANTRKNKIEGTPILKLAKVKRLKVNKNLQKKFVKKIRHKN